MRIWNFDADSLVDDNQYTNSAHKEGAWSTNRQIGISGMAVRNGRRGALK